LSASPDSDASFSDSAITFLQATLTKQDFVQLDISSLQLLKNNESNIAIHIPEKGSSLKMVLLRKSNNSFDGNKVDFSNLNQNSSGKYSGEILLTTFQNAPLNSIFVKNNKVEGIFHPAARMMSAEPDNDDTKKNKAQVLDEVFVIGYIPVKSPDYASLYWLFNQYAPFNHLFTNNMISGSGSGSSAGTNGTNQLVTAPTYISPEHPVKNIVEDLKCFTIHSRNSYSVTVNVNQPNPNTRDLTNIAADYMAGHTFISLNEQFPDGSTMVRNIGFYPMNGAKPGSEMDKSVFGDDSETPFSVSLNISLSAQEFQAIRSAVYSQQKQNYLLTTFNCTNAVISSLQAGNINLPQTLGSNALFIGINPADLGQDIRELNLSKFSAENGGRKVVRTVNDVNTMKASPRRGGC
jgi:hypothetical protein